MSRSSARRVARALGGGLLVVTLGACAGGDQESADPTPSPTPTTLAELDTAGRGVPRLEFCGLVPDAAVTAALGATPASVAAREPGDDSFQEVGCTWGSGEGPRPVTARAWVFAQPVTESVAERTVAEAGDRRGCQVEGQVDAQLGDGLDDGVDADAAAYGEPAVVQRCRTADGPRVRYAGLVGDTWLTCELQGPGAPGRAEAWCTAVLDALLADE